MRSHHDLIFISCNTHEEHFEIRRKSGIKHSPRTALQLLTTALGRFLQNIRTWDDLKASSCLVQLRPLPKWCDRKTVPLQVVPVR